MSDSTQGNCFVAMPPNTASDSVIIGRNSENPSLVGVAQEVAYYEPSESLEGKRHLLPDCTTPLRVVLQKPSPGVWGGDCGSNERSVSIAITWANEIKGDVTVYDVIRLALASSETADDAFDCILELITRYGDNDAKFSLIVGDPTKVWIISCAGKNWAGQQILKGVHHLPNDGMAVTKDYERSNEDLGESLRKRARWDGESAIDFAAAFDASPSASTEWCGDKPPDDGTFSVTDMFETLRAAAKEESSRSASVFVLSKNGISSHWFTATPNTSESVFKPFVFAPKPKISPLTKAPPDGGNVTLLHKLHGQRKTSALEHLKALEAACVEEVTAYLKEHPTVTEELDELMKDCVEAEVKFYR
ncbi:secernin-2 [Musca autumnalis]|uniref:secernin-2 n=1 Tax=Musca autumnalis TaxID=221902 RepID=UPI003CF87ADF